MIEDNISDTFNINVEFVPRQSSLESDPTSS